MLDSRSLGSHEMAITSSRTITSKNTSTLDNDSLRTVFKLLKESIWHKDVPTDYGLSFQRMWWWWTRSLFFMCCDQELEQNKNRLVGKYYQPKGLYPGCLFAALKISLKKGSVAVHVFQIRKLENSKKARQVLYFLHFCIQETGSLHSFKLCAIFLLYSSKPWLPL